ncbi:hypothetical protein GCM10009801_26360 [Streptomyces albiaxialis]|uniref:Uncharacterized protein n=1 Tax=Streptomyces albiaxialis TaxID=329523 RepID=A0ABP5HEA2_9ACTN
MDPPEPARSARSGPAVRPPPWRPSVRPRHRFRTGATQDGAPLSHARCTRAAPAAHPFRIRRAYAPHTRRERPGRAAGKGPGKDPEKGTKKSGPVLEGPAPTGP